MSWSSSVGAQRAAILCRQGAEAGGLHAQWVPRAGGGQMVQGLAGEVFGEVAEDERGPVGVLDPATRLASLPSEGVKSRS